MSEQGKIAEIIMNNFSAFGVRDSQALAVAKEIIEAVTTETLRDKFAMHASHSDVEQFLPKNYGEWRSFETNHYGINANVWARYQFADAMLAQRNKVKP